MNAKIVKEKREAAGLTQEQLANAVGVVRTHITNIETGKFQPSVQVAKAIGKTLKFDWSLIFGGDEE